MLNWAFTRNDFLKIGTKERFLIYFRFPFKFITTIFGSLQNKHKDVNEILSLNLGVLT